MAQVIIPPMGLEVDYHNENKPNSTPKLSLSKLQPKPSESIQMLTPPLHQSLSIPFQWEVAPGKARPTDAASTCTSMPSKVAAARRLDLPPRLILNDDSKNISIMSSPKMVLDGPYVGRSLSLACTFSFRKGVEDGGRLKKGKGGARNFGSGRWGSFKEEGKLSLSDAFKNEKNLKRFKRRSFFNLSRMNSNTWVSSNSINLYLYKETHRLE
ncbi:hypothetical protein F511_04003 [Dorcoceras hygrometricum]|uniref:Uncharacterized protein n=1 Tax=Dorcoceras hygrometricum TaxID=472368 RepID=A0A2Z7AE56_9LAMI|nr:hypothetical protein F511_04003 [Dorcoceras hygrometricum]